MPPNAPTRDFADGVLRELSRMQEWNDDQERRIRKLELKMAVVWFVGSVVVVVGGWVVSLIVG